MARRPSWYADKLAALRPVSRTTIKARTNFTPQQKATITRQWNKYKAAITGNNTFKALTPSQIRTLRNAGYTRTTNKGVFVKGKAKVSIRGRGKATSLTIRYVDSPRKDIALLIPSAVTPDNFMEWAISESKRRGAKSVGITIKGMRSQLTFAVDDFDFDGDNDNYLQQLIATGVPVTGIYMVYR